MTKLSKLSNFTRTKIRTTGFLMLTMVLILTGCVSEPSENFYEVFGEDVFEGYKQIRVDGGNLSGDREANVYVNIGYGDREYYAFTNDYGQLIKVIAKEVVLQDDENEKVLSTGRYYHDEAKVPGVESATLDEGHIIADSLGGVANAYNITPQNSTLNRHGDQAYMEEAIRKAKGCSNFTALIFYPNNKTQIPSRYSFTYTLNGKVIHDEFDNGDPEEHQDQMVSTSIEIVELDKKAEFIVLKNISSESLNLKDWTILSVRGNQTFVFLDHLIGPGETVIVGDSENNSNIDYHWLAGGGTWNNSKSDAAELYDNHDILIDVWQD